MTEEHGAREGGRDWGVIVPPFLDDYGLDPYEMRVYIRLARRAGMGGQCWESTANMAANCKMSQQKVKNSLALLKAAHLIRQIKRPGKSDLYELMPQQNWVKPGELDALRIQVTAYRAASDQKYLSDCAERSAGGNRASQCHKGNRALVNTELQCSSLPDYSVVNTGLQCSSPPDYTVANTELQCSYEDIPVRISQEDIPKTPLTPQVGTSKKAGGGYENLNVGFTGKEPVLVKGKSESFCCEPTEKDWDHHSVASTVTISKQVNASNPIRDRTRERFSRTAAVQPYEIRSGVPDPEFVKWRAQYYANKQDGLGNTPSANAKSEIRNNPLRALDMWSDYKNHLAKKLLREGSFAPGGTQQEMGIPRSIPSASELLPREHQELIDEFHRNGAERFFLDHPGYQPLIAELRRRRSCKDYWLKAEREYLGITGVET